MMPFASIDPTGRVSLHKGLNVVVCDHCYLHLYLGIVRVILRTREKVSFYPAPSTGKKIAFDAEQQSFRLHSFAATARLARSKQMRISCSFWASRRRRDSLFVEGFCFLTLRVQKGAFLTRSSMWTQFGTLIEYLTHLGARFPCRRIWPNFSNFKNPN